MVPFLYFPKWIFQGFYREVPEQCDLCTWTASTCGALQVQILNPRDLECSETSGKISWGNYQNNPRSNKEPTALDHDFIDHVVFRGRNHAENSLPFPALSSFASPSRGHQSNSPVVNMVNMVDPINANHKPHKPQLEMVYHGVYRLGNADRFRCDQCHFEYSVQRALQLSPDIWRFKL